MKNLDLNKIYRLTLKDCGKNPSPEFVEQEFLHEVNEQAKKELREMMNKSCEEG